MQKLRYSILINAPKEKVWDVMLGEQTYREWTKEFSEGSYYQGEWKEGSKMLFLGPDPDTGEEGGMVSYIRVVRPYEFLSIEHIGIVANGQEDTTSEEARKWVPAFENYTFRETPEGTEVIIDIDVNEEYKDMFDEGWPRALEALKNLAEAAV